MPSARKAKYTKEKLKYYRMTSMINDVVSDGLRTIFKRQWDSRYQITHGTWDNSCRIGQILYNKEKARYSGKKYLPKFKSGDFDEWDCTVLFDAILYSNAIGRAGLAPNIKKEVDSLREVRNSISHVPRGQLSETEFQDASKKVHGSFQALGLSTAKIDEIRKEKIFLTSELEMAIAMIAVIACVTSVLIYALLGKSNVSSFKLLPTHPSHEVINRTGQASKIIQTLRKLSNSNNGKLSYLYISGNPGSGKSQLARLIGERYHTDDQNGVTFVMTLDAKSTNSLLESYEDFARRLSCAEDIVMNIVNSTRATEAKIRRLKTQIGMRINKYYSWLIIVDDVENLTLVSPLLPQSNDAEWKGGQVLITTQDSSHIPPNSTFTAHVSVSPGMDENESCHLLATLSGTGDHPMLGEVAKMLDYQPLALAAAAFYLKQLRETKVSPDFSWQNYLQKLNEGKRKLMEEQLGGINQNYPVTMTTAVLLAVEKAAEADGVLNHTFHFLSLVSHESLPLEVAIDYVLQVDKSQDKEHVGVKIRKCSLILAEDHDVVYIRLHRVIHDAIKIYSRKCETVITARRFVDTAKSFDKFKCRNFESNFIPHLIALRPVMTKLFNVNNKIWYLENAEEIRKIMSRFFNVLQRHGEFLISKDYLTIVQDIIKTLKSRKENQGLHSYANVAYLDHEQGKTMSDLGAVSGRIGDLPAAKKNLETARDTILRLYGPNHIDLAIIFDNLGDLYLKLDDMKQAEHYFKLSLDIRIQQLGSDHPHFINSYVNFGNFYLLLADLKKAKEYYLRALAHFDKHITSSTDYDVQPFLTCLNNLGITLYYMGEMEQAMGHLRFVHDHRLDLYGPHHVDLADTYYHMALIYYDFDELAEAKEYFEKALAIYKKHIHVEFNKYRVFKTNENLGVVHHAMGNLELANQCYKDANRYDKESFRKKDQAFCDRLHN